MPRRSGELDDQDRADHAEEMEGTSLNTDARKEVTRARADETPPERHPERDILTSESAAPHEIQAAQNRIPETPGS